MSSREFYRRLTAYTEDDLLYAVNVSEFLEFDTWEIFNDGYLNARRDKAYKHYNKTVKEMGGQHLACSINIYLIRIEPGREPVFHDLESPWAKEKSKQLEKEIFNDLNFILNY